LRAVAAIAPAGDLRVLCVELVCAMHAVNRADCGSGGTMAATRNTENNGDQGRGGSPQAETTQQGSPQSSSTPQSSSAPQSPGSLTRSRNRPGALARSLGTFGPFSLMRRLFDDLERLTGIELPDERGERRGLDSMMFVPMVEVRQRDDKLVVSVDLPGMSSDDIEITVEDGALIIEGERRSEHEHRDGDVWRCERSYGRFQRAIPLPEGVDTETAEARFENGVLQISLQAPERVRHGRKIDIKSSGASSGQAKPGTSH
jgi:HSP20 family protein